MSKSTLGEPLHIVRNFDEVVVLFEQLGLSGSDATVAGDKYTENLKQVAYKDLPTERAVPALWSGEALQGFSVALHPDGTLQARRAEPFSSNELDKLESMGLEAVG